MTHFSSRNFVFPMKHRTNNAFHIYYIYKRESLNFLISVLRNYHTKYIILYTYGFCIMRRVSLAYNLGHYVNKGLSLFSNSIVAYEVNNCTKCPNRKNNGPLLYQMVYILYNKVALFFQLDDFFTS